MKKKNKEHKNSTERETPLSRAQPGVVLMGPDTSPYYRSWQPPHPCLPLRLRLLLVSHFWENQRRKFPERGEDGRAEQGSQAGCCVLHRCANVTLSQKPRGRRRNEGEFMLLWTCWYYHRIWYWRSVCVCVCVCVCVVCKKNAFECVFAGAFVCGL